MNVLYRKEIKHLRAVRLFQTDIIRQLIKHWYIEFNQMLFRKSEKICKFDENIAVTSQAKLFTHNARGLMIRYVIY